MVVKNKNPLRSLTRFELGLWLCSVSVVTGAFLLSPACDILTLVACIIGVTALIFVAKGYPIGQIMTVVFAALYGIISIGFKYYGEAITYLGMTAPIAILAVISWTKHPYAQTPEVKVNRMSCRAIIIMFALTALVTCALYFVLRALNTTNLFFSTVSVATSFIASYLTLMRSSCYALGYAANDLVLIVLWTLATFKDISYLPMTMCFCVFFINDAYGFINWRRMQRRQEAEG